MIKKFIKYLIVIFLAVIGYNYFYCDNYYNYGRDTVYTFGEKGRIQIDVLTKNKRYIVTDVSKKFVIDYISKYDGPFIFGNKLYLKGDAGLYVVQKEPFRIMYININNNDNQLDRLKKEYSKKCLSVYSSIKNLDEDDNKKLAKLIN